MNKPLVSVITVTYNSGKTIMDTLQSVAGQSYPHIEHIVIDGGSTDGTKDIAAHYPHIIFISEPDQGPYDAMNKGIARAKGDIVAILNADDMYASREVIEHVVEAMEEHTLDVLWGNLVYVDRRNPSRVMRMWKSLPYARRKWRWGWHPPHPTFFVRKKMYEAYGVFRLDFKIAADYELMLRFLEVPGLRWGHMPEVLVRMRTGGLSNRSFKNIILANREVVHALRLHGIRAAWTVFFLKPFSKLKQYFVR